MKSQLKIQDLKTKIIISGPITLWQTEGEKVEAVTDFILGQNFHFSKSLWMVTAAMKLKDATPRRESYDKPRSHFKK